MTVNEIWRERQTRRLWAKIEAVNKVHTLANELQPKLIAAFKPWEGKKIATVGFTLVKQARDLVREVCGSCHHYVGNVNYSFYVHLQAHASNGDQSHQAEVPVKVGEVEGHTLKCVAVLSEPLRTNYTVEEVLQLRHELTQARDVMRSFESQLCLWGEHDN